MLSWTSQAINLSFIASISPPSSPPLSSRTLPLVTRQVAGSLFSRSDCCGFRRSGLRHLARIRTSSDYRSSSSLTLLIAEPLRPFCSGRSCFLDQSWQAHLCPEANGVLSASSNLIASQSLQPSSLHGCRSATTRLLASDSPNRLLLLPSLPRTGHPSSPCLSLTWLGQNPVQSQLTRRLRYF